MKTVILLLMSMLFITSCVTKVQDKSLWPAITNSSPRVVGDAKYGGLAAADSEQFLNAVNNKNGIEVKRLWPGVKEAALKGIDKKVTDGKASQGAAKFLRDRVMNFDEAVAELKPTSSINKERELWQAKVKSRKNSSNYLRMQQPRLVSNLQVAQVPLQNSQQIKQQDYQKSRAKQVFRMPYWQQETLSLLKQE